MAATVGHGFLVARSNLTTLHNTYFYRKVEGPHVDPETLSLVPRNWNREVVAHRLVYVYPVWT